MKKLIFITGNKNKLKYFMQYSDFPINHIDLDLTEIQSLDVNKIVEHKAKEAYKIIQNPVLVEDVSLSFSALGKLPGPLVKWFLEAIDKEGLCRLLDNYEDKSAIASVTYALYDGKKMELFEGHANGTIADHPKGGNGFGWTSIFIPKGDQRTWGEMTDQEQSETSMRKIAIEKISKYIKKI